MGESGVKTFVCPTCGTRFGHKPEFAGKRIKCKCGTVFTAPAFAAQEEAGPTYDLVERWEPEQKKPRGVPGRVPVEGGSVPCAESPAAEPPGPAPAREREREREREDDSFRSTPYPTRRRVVASEAEDEPAEFSTFRDVVAPVALLVLGIGLRLGQTSFDKTMSGTAADNVATVILQVFFTVGLMLVGVVISAAALGVNFGAVQTAVLKLTAIAVFAWSAAMFILAVNHDAPGMIVALHAVVVIYVFAFWALFALDAQEAVLTTVVVTLFQLAAACALLGRHGRHR